MLTVIEQAHEEKVKMYSNSTKERLIEMLISCHTLLESFSGSSLGDPAQAIHLAEEDSIESKKPIDVLKGIHRSIRSIHQQGLDKTTKEVNECLKNNPPEYLTKEDNMSEITYLTHELERCGAKISRVLHISNLGRKHSGRVALKILSNQESILYAEAEYLRASLNKAEGRVEEDRDEFGAKITMEDIIPEESILVGKGTKIEHAVIDKGKTLVVMVSKKHHHRMSFNIFEINNFFTLKKS